MLTNFPATKPQETNPGTISLRANMIRVNTNPAVLHHYAVTFEPAVARPRVADIFYRITKDLIKVSHAFDGMAILVTKEKIQNDESVFEYAKGTKKIIISYKNSYDINDVNSYINKKYEGDISLHLQCLDIISRGYQSQTGYVERRKIFSGAGSSEINSLLQIWTGLAQNFRVTKMGLVNNVDLAFQVMYENCTLLEFIAKLTGDQGQDRGRRPPQNRYDDGRNMRRGGNDTDEEEMFTEVTRNEQLGGYNGRDNRPPRGPRDDPPNRDRPSHGRDGYKGDDRRGGYGNEGRGGYNDNRGGGYNDNRGGGYNDNRGGRGGYNDNRSGGYGNRGNRGNDEQPRMSFDQVYNNSSLLKSALAKLTDLMKKVKFTTNHMDGGRNISFYGGGVSEQDATQIKLVFEDKEISVAEYFEKKYQKLSYPNLPCVIRKRSNMDDSYYPMEVLSLMKNQKFTKKLDDFQTSKMIRVAAKRPTDRFRIIEQKIREFNVNENPMLKEFNIGYDNNFLACKGKILPAPKLEYGKGRTQFIEPREGSWNLRGLRALEPIEIRDWVFAYQDDIRIDRDKIVSAMNSLSAVCNSFGLILSNNFRTAEITGPNSYNEMLESLKPSFIIFLLASKDSATYAGIKRSSETIKNAVVTQCVLNSNFHKFNDPTFCSNIAMKINVKLKGKNWKLADQNNPIGLKSTIVFGADVNHPGQGDLHSPSIAAVTASIDLTQNTYSTKIQQQERHIEIIHKIEDIIFAKVTKFISINNVKPERIIFFRDGVGESQFYTVYEKEIMGIKTACEAIDPAYKPKITYIIAQKRHSVRFELLGNPKSNDNSDYNKRPNSQDRSTGNVTPGTVVDDIAHPVLYDFYMVSHHALQGTARPVRYQVLIDENNFPTQEIQEIINNMCYQYPRATKAVSVVAPIYFAHLAAARAKCYLATEKDDVSENGPTLKLLNPGLEDQLFYM